MNSSAASVMVLWRVRPCCAVVLPAEGDAALIEGDEPGVGDRHAVRVARQIGQHRLGPGEGALGVDDPFALTQRREPVGEGLGIAELGVLAEELQLPGAMQALQLFEEAAPEQPRQHPHRQEEPRPARHPALAVGGEAAAGHDAVHVRMVRQRRAPGVQHQRGADPRTQVLRIGGDGAQRLGGDVEQQSRRSPPCCSRRWH